MDIGSIGTLGELNSKLQENQNSQTYADVDFGKVLMDAAKDVNSKQIKAYDSMHDIATGKVDNLQEAVMNIDKAELSLKLGLELKTKLINSYREIIKMQI
jgi:flagellar hook-basal body complex protein FliE